MVRTRELGVALMSERRDLARFAPSCSRPINEVLIFGEHGEHGELARAAESGTS
jgi:hypothetical protein